MKIEKMQQVVERIRSLPDRELLKSTMNIVKKERGLLAVLIEHIAEIEVRKLYSELRYSSIYD